MLSTDLVISEFMAANSTTLLDQDNASSDWIEIHNTTVTPLVDTGAFVKVTVPSSGALGSTRRKRPVAIRRPML